MLGQFVFAGRIEADDLLGIRRPVAGIATLISWLGRIIGERSTFHSLAGPVSVGSDVNPKEGATGLCNGLQEPVRVKSTPARIVDKVSCQGLLILLLGQILGEILMKV